MRGQKAEERDRERERERKRGRVHKSFRVRVLSATLVTGDRTKKERDGETGGSFRSCEIASKLARQNRKCDGGKTMIDRKRKSEGGKEERDREREGESRVYK